MGTGKSLRKKNFKRRSRKTPPKNQVFHQCRSGRRLEEKRKSILKIWRPEKKKRRTRVW